MTLARGVEIGTLSAKTHLSDQSANLRNELDIVLNSADLQPPGMPPAAILIVKAVADPLPGEFRDRRSRLRVNSTWERAAQNQLEVCFRNAARPRRGRIPDDCESVVFRDEAELLACLAVDLVNRSASSRWWWRVVTGRRVRDLAAVLVEEAALVPAIIDALDEWNEAGNVIDSLTHNEIRAVAAGLAVRPGSLNPVWAHAFERDETIQSGSRTVAQHGAEEIFQSAMLETFPPPDGASRASIDRATLIGIALTLFRRPAVAGTPAFSYCLQRWRDYWMQSGSLERPRDRGPEIEFVQSAAGRGHDDREDHPATAPSGRPEVVNSNEQEHEDEWTRAASDGNLPQSETPDRRRTISSRESAVESASTRSTGRARHHRSEANPESDRHRPADLDESIDSESSTARNRNENRSHGNVESAGHESVEIDTGFVTELGGLFYLVAIVVELDSPPELSRWALFETLARAFLPNDTYDDDAIWPALREIDGRPPDAPPPPEAGDWLAPRLAELRHRLQVIAAACERDPPAGFEFAPLFLHRARVIITRARVDVMFRLDQILLPVRSAGLDRDPGWRPEFGRVIRFHFGD